MDDFLEGREPTTPEGDYRYFDPKQIKVSDVTRSKTPFNEAIVFIVGGGNYIEYQNLVDYCKVKSIGLHIVLDSIIRGNCLTLILS